MKRHPSVSRQPEPNWLFGDFGKPLFTSSTLELLANILNAHGQNLLRRNREELVARVDWTEPTASDRRELASKLRAIFSEHCVVDASIGVPSLFLEEELAFSDLPASLELHNGLRAYFGQNEAKLLDFDFLEVRSLLSVGLGWWEIFELTHLVSWLPEADLRNLAKLDRNDPDTWAVSFARILAYRSGPSHLAQLGDALVGRFSFGSQKYTLAGAGELLGVTRERMRQLEVLARKMAASRPLAPPRLLKILPDDLSGLADLLPGWSSEALANFASFAGIDMKGSFADNAFVTAAVLERANPVVKEIVQKNAGHSGFVNLLELGFQFKTAGVSSSVPVLDLLSSIYEVTASTSNWAWIRKSTKNSHGFSAVYNQLALGTALTASELFEGLERKLRSRQLEHELPPLEEFRKLLAQHEEFLEDSGHFYLATDASVPSEGNVGWLISRFTSANSRAMPIEEITAEGAALGFKPSTTAQYLWALEQFRAKNNVAWLVSAPPSKFELETVTQRAASLEEASAVEFVGVLEDRTTLLMLKMGTVFFRSGQITVPSSLRPIVANPPREIQCFCGANEGRSLGVTNSGQLKSAGWIRNHLSLHSSGPKFSAGSVVFLKLFPDRAVLAKDSEE